MIVLYILFGILLLLLFPLTARYRFQDQGHFVVRYLGIPVYVYSTVKNKEQEKTDKQTKKSRKKKTKDGKDGTVKRVTSQLKEGGAAGVLMLLQEGIRFVESNGRRLVRALRFGRCRVSVRFGGSEAADIALRYGKFSGPIHSARSVLLSMLRVRRLELVMQPDFMAEKDVITADIRVRSCPLRLLWTALCMTVSGIGMLSRLTNTQSKGGKNGKKGQ